MKKVIMFAVMFAAVSSFCFAQSAPVATKSQAKPKVESKTLTGKIDSIIFADAVKGVMPEFTVTGDDGTKLDLVPAGKIKILGVDMKPITFDMLAKDQKVQIKYHITDAGVHEATSISLVK